MGVWFGEITFVSFSLVLFLFFCGPITVITRIKTNQEVIQRLDYIWLNQKSYILFETFSSFLKINFIEMKWKTYKDFVQNTYNYSNYHNLSIFDLPTEIF